MDPFPINIHLPNIPYIGELESIFSSMESILDPIEKDIKSLGDMFGECEKIFNNISDLPTGGDATGFAIIVGAVLIVLIIIVEYFSEVKMFPQLFQNDSDKTQEE